MERLAENQMRQGISSQQYTVTGANELAIMLSDALGYMQQQMQSMGQGQGSGQGKGQGQGQGSGKGFQLPDIIKKQESLSEQMKEGMGKSKGEGKGEEGEKGNEGDGESGNGNGSQGENSRSGKAGEGQGDGEGNGKGNGKGQGDGDGEEGDGEGYNEDLNGELYEIYKQQQQLRQQLKDKLSKEGLNGNGGDLLRQMEDVEQQLLDKGFNERTLEKMLNLQYELLKLDKADFEQGQESRRESTTNRWSYTNTLRLSPEEVKQYFNSTEILNREALPLKPEYKQKVQDYFKENND